MLLVEELLEFLTGSEEGQALGLDLHYFACLGVATNIPAVVFKLETPESPDFDPVPLSQGFLDGVHEDIYHHGGLISGDVVFLGQVFNQFAFIHGFLLLAVLGDALNFGLFQWAGSCRVFIIQ